MQRALFKQAFEYRAPTLWNSLPSHLRKAQKVKVPIVGIGTKNIIFLKINYVYIMPTLYKLYFLE